jgi:hypothetical protein
VVKAKVNMFNMLGRLGSKCVVPAHALDQTEATTAVFLSKPRMELLLSFNVVALAVNINIGRY